MQYLNLKQNLISSFDKILNKDGVVPTSIKGLTLMRRSGPSLRQAIVYQPSIYLVLQGEKRAYLEDETYTYDAFNYLVLTLPLPIEANIIQASALKPYLALRLDIDLEMIRELLVDMSLDNTHEQAVSRAIHVSPIEEELLNGFSRLMALNYPQGENFDNHQRILIPLIKKEIFYHVLCGKQGGLLKNIAQGQRQQAKVAKAIHRIQTHIKSPLDVQVLAKEVNMSVSSFHQYFKEITGHSPLQYIKTLRLHLAKRLLLQGGHSIGDAAFQVGYNSASQFSREYKRLFNMSPSKALSELVN